MHLVWGLCRAFSPQRLLGQLTWAFNPGYYVSRLWRLRHSNAARLQHKSKDGDLKAAYKQPANYDEDLENPALRVVCSFVRFEMRTKFENSPTRVYAFTLDDLPVPRGTQRAAVRRRGSSGRHVISRAMRRMIWLSVLRRLVR